MDVTDEMQDMIDRLIRIGPFKAMCEDERAAGFEPVQPGSVPWLSADDWPDDVVISIKGRAVRIVAIKAKRRGAGAFSRLIGAIAYAGLEPIVVEPMFDMHDILRRWGWKERIVGSGRAREQQWRPSVKWLLNRSASLKAAIERRGAA